VVGTLATLALILPNYTLSAVGPFYSTAQLMFVGALSLALWCIFVFVQILGEVRHRKPPSVWAIRFSSPLGQ